MSYAVEITGAIEKLKSEAEKLLAVSEKEGDV